MRLASHVDMAVLTPRRFASREAAATTWFLGRWLALAFVLESLMLAWVPPAAVAQWVGQGGPYSIPLAVLIGVPMYANAAGIIPIVAALLSKGDP